jgi:hypothetical protein
MLQKMCTNTQRLGLMTKALYNSLHILMLADLHNTATRAPQVKGLERPPPRHGHATCAIREKLFVFGGSSSEGQLLNDLWIYDQVCMGKRGVLWARVVLVQCCSSSTLEQWLLFPAMRCCLAGLPELDVRDLLWECTSATQGWVGGVDALVGSQPPTPSLLATQCTVCTHSDISTHTCPALPGATLCATEDGRRLYLFGGSDGSRALNDVYFLELEKLSWTFLPVHVRPGTDNPTAALLVA